MAAGPIIKLVSSDATDRTETWQLLKSPTLVQTALTVAQLCQNLDDVSFTEGNGEAVDVSRFESIMVQFWGAIAADNTTPVVDLYGWHASGPGAHIGKLTLAHANFTSLALTGWHTSVKTAAGIRAAFAPDVALRGCDTCTVTADYEAEMMRLLDGAALAQTMETHRAIQSPATLAVPPVYLPHADFPTFAIVDFSRSRYKYFGALVTTAAATASATLGAIYRPLVFRSEFGPVIRAR